MKATAYFESTPSLNMQQQEYGYVNKGKSFSHNNVIEPTIHRPCCVKRGLNANPKK